MEVKNTFSSTFKVWIFDIIYKFFKEETINKINEEINLKIDILNNSIDEIVKNTDSLEILKQINEIIKNIFHKLNFNKYLEDFISKIKFESEEKSSIHKNILVIGKAGVGKSTLINSFLEISEAETGIGEAITQNFNSYISKPDNSFRLFDSKGIGSSYIESLNSIKSFINSQLLLDKDEFIHFIWYCINGTRYSDDDKMAINDLLSSYEDDCLPIIVVYTQTIDDTAETFLKKIKDFLGENNDKIKYIEVLAKDKKIGRNNNLLEKSFGLKELKEMTLERISKAINSSFYQSIRERIINLYKNNINEKLKKIKEKVNAMINITQYHTINLLNFEIFFFEVLNLIFFNDNNSRNLKSLIFEENNLDNNNNDLLIKNINYIEMSLILDEDL